MSSRQHKTAPPAKLRAVAATEVWLDKQDILTRLHISSRTLQKWRKEKILSYTRIRGKIWYLESDLMELLRKNMVISQPKNE